MYMINRMSRQVNSFFNDAEPVITEIGQRFASIAELIAKCAHNPKLFYSHVDAHFDSVYPLVLLQDAQNQEDDSQLQNIREVHRSIGLLGLKLSATAASVALLATASLGVASLAWGVGLGLTAISIIRTGNESVQQTIDSMKDFGTAATSATLQAVVVGAAAIYTFLFCKGTFMLVGALVKGFATGIYLGVSLIGKAAVALGKGLASSVYLGGALAGKAAVAGYTGLKAGVYFAAPHVVKASTVALAALKSFGLFVGTKLAHGVTTGVAAAKSGAPIAASYIADKAVVGLAAVKSGLMFCYNLRG